MKAKLVEQNHITSDIKQKEVKNIIDKMDSKTKTELLGNMNMWTMKAKGVPGICLQQDFYADSEGHVVEFDGLKKIHKTITLKQKNDGISNFSIINNHQTRTFNKSTWSGFDFKDGQWFPKIFSSTHELTN